jgi:hypothetical protein
MTYVFVHTPERLKVAVTYPPARELRSVAEAVDLLRAYRQGRRDYPVARGLLHDTFMLGWHMVTERACVDMVRTGSQIQARSLDRLRELYALWQPPDHAERVKAMREYAGRLGRCRAHHTNKLRLLWRTQPEPGDVFNVVRNDRDPAWRIQGLLALGIVRFTAASGGDVRCAQTLIAEHVDSAERLEAAAARAARDLTAAEFRRLGAAPDFDGHHTGFE